MRLQFDDEPAGRYALSKDARLLAVRVGYRLACQTEQVQRALPSLSPSIKRLLSAFAPRPGKDIKARMDRDGPYASSYEMQCRYQAAIVLVKLTPTWYPSLQQPM